ncbi:MAG TPA: response regulator [Pricia sp.]|nr:response regulator [Pricia sp.]
MRPITLYLADDDMDDRELFIDALKEIPLTTETTQFENGIDLMADLFSDSSLPHAVYLDLHMPMMDGFECLEDIRSVPEFSEIQIVIYSTSHNQSEVEELRAAGANQYLRKPTSFNQLKTLLYHSLQLVAEVSEDRKKHNTFEVLL